MRFVISQFGMSSAEVQSQICRVAAFYLQPDHIRFPFRLPDPAKRGIILRKGWLHLVSLETLERMAGHHQDTMFLCTFPVSLLVRGGDFGDFRTGHRLRIGQAEARITISGDICGAQSQSCGFSEACLLRTEALMAEVTKEGIAQVGDPVLRVLGKGFPKPA